MGKKKKKTPGARKRNRLFRVQGAGPTGYSPAEVRQKLAEA